MSGAEPLVVCAGAGRTYGRGSSATVALQPTDCEIRAGDRVALLGPSGSGKSTLLHLMAGLDLPSIGAVTWPAIGTIDELRPGPVAVVFQGPSLLPPLTVAQNIALPLVLAGLTDAYAAGAARAALERLDLLTLADKLPEEISSGQAQRVAIARALAGEPRLVLADEPTGQLDRANSVTVVELLVDAAEHAGAALVISTHDSAVADRLSERWELRSGRLVSSRVPAAAWSR